MSFFNETYNEARSISPEQVTRGKRVSFMEAFDIAFDTQVRGAAAFGIQEAMRNLDDEQRQAMKKAGLEDIPSLSSRADDPLRMFTDFGEDYLNVARFVQNGGTPEMKQRIDEYNAKIGDIRKRYPTLSLMTAEEMWNTVRNKAQEAERSNIGLLDAGADDYLVKPFSISELLARMRVTLRHRGTVVLAPQTHYRCGTVEVDLAKHTVSQAGEAVHLTPTEFKLLARLVRQAGQVVTHRQLLVDVWGAEHVDQTHYLRLYMGQLRAKLEANPTEPALLLTEPGVGYRLAE